MDLGVADDAALRRDEEGHVARSGLAGFGDAREDPEVEGLGLREEESLRRAARRLRDAERIHREAGVEHLGEDGEARAAGRGLGEHRRGAAVVFGDVFPGDVGLEEGDLHGCDALTPSLSRGERVFNLRMASFRVSSRLQKAKRT